MTRLVAATSSHLPENQAAQSDPNVLVIVQSVPGLTYPSGSGQPAYGSAWQSWQGGPILVSMNPDLANTSQESFLTTAHEFVHVNQLRIGDIPPSGNLSESEAYFRETQVGGISR